MQRRAMQYSARMSSLSPQQNGIQVEALVRVFKKGPRAVDGINLEVAPGEIYGFARPQRRRQVDRRVDAHHVAAAHVGHGARRGF